MKHQETAVQRKAPRPFSTRVFFAATAPNILPISLMLSIALLTGCKSESSDAKDSGKSGEQTACEQCLANKCAPYEDCQLLDACVDIVHCVSNCTMGDCDSNTSCTANTLPDAESAEVLADVMACIYSICANACQEGSTEFPTDTMDTAETDSQTPCDTEMKTRCYFGMVIEFNDCGYEETIDTCTAHEYCEEGACLPCESHAQKVCDDDTVIWQDSCGFKEDDAEVCSETQYCSDGQCIACESHYSFTCADETTIYWEDSCFNIEDIKEECGANQLCIGSGCVDCVSHHHLACDGRDVRWFDACSRAEDIAETCADTLFCVNDQCETYPNECVCECTCEGVANTVIEFSCERRTCFNTCEENCEDTCMNQFQSSADSATGECH